MSTAITPAGTQWRAEVHTERMFAVTWCATRAEAEQWVEAMKQRMRR